CFFFSSRRRHTRFSRDWSSDVCSSDLAAFYHVHDLHGKMRQRKMPTTDDRMTDARLTDNHGGMTRMRYLSLLLTLAALLLLAACQPNVDPQETQEPETGPTATAPLPAEGEATEESGPQVQASPTPDGYPAAPRSEERRE